MNVFAVVATQQSAVGPIKTAIEAKYPNNFVPAGDRLWFVAGNEATVIDSAKRLGVKGMDPNATLTDVIMLPVTTYWGYSSPTIWEWLRNKLQEKVVG